MQGALHPKKWVQGFSNSQSQNVKLLCFPTFGARGHGWFYCVWWPQSCVFLACDSWNSWIQSGPKLWQFSAWTLQGWQRFVLSLLRSPWCDSLANERIVLCEVIMTSEKRPAPKTSTKEESEYIILAFFKVACGFQHDLRDIFSWELGGLSIQLQQDFGKEVGIDGFITAFCLVK